MDNTDMNDDADDEDFYDSEYDEQDLEFADFLMDEDENESWHTNDDDNDDDEEDDDDDYEDEEFEDGDYDEDEGNDDNSGEDTEETPMDEDDNMSEVSTVSSARSSQAGSNVEAANQVLPQPALPPALPPVQPSSLNQHQENDPVENIVQSHKKIKLDLPELIVRPLSPDDMIDDDQKCPICLETWTNAGEHRLCSLRCGHLFGMSCIIQWLSRTQNAKNCPECKAKATKKDVRVLYAKKLICIDTVEKEKLQMQLNDANAKHKTIEQELSLYRTKEEAYRAEISNMKQKIHDLQSQLAIISAERTALNVTSENSHLSRTKIYDIQGSCRVMAYNPWNKILAISSDNSINRIFLEHNVTSLPVCVHSNSIRDIAFQEQHPNFLLSVGFDKKVILTDIRTACLSHSYKEETNLWSCCWSNYNQQAFFVGGAKGSVMEYDIRFLQSSVSTKDHANDHSPVVSLASIPTTSPTMHAGGFLACQLNSCYAYSYKEGNYMGNQIDVEGPFLYLRYNDKDNHVLLSCRPNAKNPTIRHNVCTIEKRDDQIKFNAVHSFNGGSMQKLLSRPCYMNLPNDTLVIANNDSDKSLLGWSISTGTESFKLPMAEEVLDMCSFEYDGTRQAVLTKNKLHLFKHKSTST
ncbi:E3 ubiquitin-protein ligase RFWD3 [Copidosoma floridanum]|uniref:E3 ubiquitin-protein ligase RFWD3 n=1 Tax=Copidosoma floridanum TaxID=29053 RepID=UPI0006C989F3|nr:E3 ubiquitin-protein ligase RFWD3 [Copidosoma floridanum]